MRRFRSFVAAIAVPVLAAPAFGAPTDDDVARVKTLTGLQDLQVVDLDLPAWEKEISIFVPIDGEPRELVLFPTSTRSASYQVFFQDEQGWHEAEPAPVRTLRGYVEGAPESVVAASLLDDGLHAWVQVSADEQYWVEPLTRFLDDADPGAHAVYQDEATEGLGGACGTEHEPVLDAGEHGEQGGAAAGGALCVTQLGCDADFEYFQDWGSIAGVQNRINQVINSMNVQYENQCGITHEITTILVRTSPGAPYTSTDANALLNQFQSEWFSNQGGIQRDVAKLFTGKSLNGSVIGIAWTIGSICSNFSSYCLSESDFNGVFACTTDLAAHELGHLWGAFHCNCPNNTMNSFITCANSFTQGSINSINAELNQSPCVDCSGPTGPENDNCADAIPISNGNTAYSTIGANTDGPPLPGSCDEGFGTDFGSDIWYSYVPDCTGTLTVSTCDQANYDTRLAAYSGNCNNLNLIACNDDGAGCGGFTSVMQVPVTCNEPVLLRVGGFGGDSGTGTLSLSCDGTCEGEEVELVEIDLQFGTLVGGGIPEASASDNSYYEVDSNTAGVRNFVLTEMVFQSPINSVSDLNVSIEVGSPGVSPVFRSFWIWNQNTGSYDLLDFGIIPNDGTDTTYTYNAISNPNQYVSNSGEIRLRVAMVARVPQTPDGFVFLVDEAAVDVSP